MNEHVAVPDRRSGPIRDLARRRPLTLFLAIVIGLTWPVLFTLLVNGQDVTPGLLFELLLLPGAAALVTALEQGRAGVRRLFAGVIRWRVGIARFVVLSTAMPLLTLLVAAVTDTLQAPAGGWVSLVGAYLFQTFVFGLLLANLWEETAWGGFVQSRLMASRAADRIAPHRRPVLRHPHSIDLRRARLAGDHLGAGGARPRTARSGRPVLPLPAGHPTDRHRRQHLRHRPAARVVQRLRLNVRRAGRVAVRTGHVVLTLAVVVYRRWRGRSFVHGYVAAADSATAPAVREPVTAG